MPINFPDSPTTGDTHTSGDKTWTYDGTAWNLVVGGVPTVVDTLTINQDAEVDGILTANHIHGNIAGSVYLHVKNTSGVTISAGSPVYATGSVGASGATEIAASDASTAATMPALGITQSELVANAEGHATILGVIGSLDTSTYGLNDSLYVAPGGGLTDTRPTALTDLVQKIGRVVRVDGSTGEILVLGAGRTNDVPNNIVAGGLTIDTNTLHVDSTNNRVGIGTTTPDSLLHLASTGTAYLRIEADTDNVTESDRPMLEFAHDGGTIGGVIGVNDNQLTLATSVQVGGGIDFRVGTTNYTTEGADVFDNTTSAMYINSSSGNVGIGTTSPAQELDVVGDIQVSGRLGIGSGISAELDIKAASNPEIRLQSTDSSDPFLYFGDQVDAVRGGIGMDTSANALQLRGYNNATRMTIDSSGHVTMPYQPCFYAYRSGTNPTHGAGWSVMSFNAELFDSNGDYNTSTYRFVAPVTGNYQFNTTLNVYNVDVSQNATQFVISLYKNGVEQTRLYQGAQYTTANQDRNRSGSAVMRMNTNDYAEIRVYSADTNYQLSAGQYWNSFSGFLIG